MGRKWTENEINLGHRDKRVSISKKNQATKKSKLNNLHDNHMPEKIKHTRLGC